MSEELKLIPFHGLGGLQNRGVAVNTAIEENFEQIIKRINTMNEKPKMGRPKKEIN